MIRIAFIALALASTACATSSPRDPPERQPLAEMRVDASSADPTSLASGAPAGEFTTARDCALAAAAIRAADAAAGWALMGACVARDDFTDLDLLVSAPWTADVARAPEGPARVALVIARRGADLERDLKLCRKRGLPFLSLRAALSEPELRRDAIVLMRGNAVDWRAAAATQSERAVEIAETRPALDEDFMKDEQLRARARRRDDVTVETGASVFASARKDAMLEPASDYVVVLRFDGMREAVVGSATTIVPMPTARVMAAYETEGTMVAWR